ncbi:MAG: aminotransferase class IV [Spirochaetales bacterium]|nr:aminotransferase class IV [Spirochaetales bacterium]
MAKGFTLEINPFCYLAQYQDNNSWSEKLIEKPHLSKEEEDKLSDEERRVYMLKRNSFEELPIVNYTTQYGMGCFEGLKAFPQKDGSLKLFRPDENAKRMATSMSGLMMPAFPPELFVNAVKGLICANQKAGFTPKYDSDWEKDDFLLGHSVYVRPFSYSEPGIGINLSYKPWVVIVSTNVGTYFMPGNTKALTTPMVRAFPGGTGWIKCSANYVISTLAKKRAIAQGYMEAIFLDAKEQKYFEEGSSCNLFFLLKNDTLVTPALRDTVLPGITRKSIMSLAQQKGIKTEERQISVDEVFAEAKEVFVSGTASGVFYIESITHNGKTAEFNNGKMGEVTHYFLKTLKGIQYGAIEDSFGWMVECKQ